MMGIGPDGLGQGQGMVDNGNILVVLGRPDGIKGVGLKNTNNAKEVDEQNTCDAGNVGGKNMGDNKGDIKPQ